VVCREEGGSVTLSGGYMMLCQLCDAVSGTYEKRRQQSEGYAEKRSKHGFGVISFGLLTSERNRG
jgi:hypothetical protein